MSYKILSAKYVSKDKSTIDFLIEDDAGNTHPFTYNKDDTAPVSNELRDYMSSHKEFIPDPYDGPSDYEKMVANVRSLRNYILCNTDKYLTIPDYPLSNIQKEEIKQFRQALRDITNQSGFPGNVLWPTVPDCIKNEIKVP